MEGFSMARKKNEEVLENKEKEKLIQDIYSDIKKEIITKLSADIKESVQRDFDDNYKEKIKDEIGKELKEELEKTIRKDQKRLISRKNFKIFRLSVYILVLIGLSLFLTYRLYRAGELTFFNRYRIVEVGEDENPSQENTNEEIVKDREWYIENYSYLLDNVHVTNLELLKGAYDAADIDITDKLAMSYKNLSDDDITVDNMIYSFESSRLQEEYVTIFGVDNNFEFVNFTVDGMSYVYSQRQGFYIAISDKDLEDQDVVNFVTDITEEDNEIIITASVALVSDGKIYNIYNTNEELGDYSEDGESYIDSLSEVRYVFVLNDGEYVLDAISRVV